MRLSIHHNNATRTRLSVHTKPRRDVTSRPERSWVKMTGNRLTRAFREGLASSRTHKRSHEAIPSPFCRFGSKWLVTHVNRIAGHWQRPLVANPNERTAKNHAPVANCAVYDPLEPSETTHRKKNRCAALAAKTHRRRDSPAPSLLRCFRSTGRCLRRCFGRRVGVRVRACVRAWPLLPIAECCRVRLFGRRCAWRRAPPSQPQVSLSLSLCLCIRVSMFLQ